MDRSKLTGVIVLMLSLVVHFFCFFGLISAHPERLLEVDSLNLSDITRSILSGVPVASWQFPPSPYLFPEILFHFPIAAMVPNVAMAQDRSQRYQSDVSLWYFRCASIWNSGA